MKAILSIFTCLMLLKSCYVPQPRGDTSENSNTIDQKVLSQLMMMPHQHLSLGKNIDRFASVEEIDAIYTHETDTSFLDSLTNNIIFDLYLYQLGRSNQGYNLLPELSLTGRSIVKHFISRNNFEDREYVVSSEVYELGLKDELSGTFNHNILDSITIILRERKLSPPQR